MPRGAKSDPGLLTNEVAAILRAQMARKQLLQNAIAEEADISQTQLSGILNGHKHIDIEQLDRLCYALGLTLRDVVGEADEATTARYLAPDWPTKPLSS
jgi:transcriptional regulator with XRE-family HTH domain